MRLSRRAFLGTASMLAGCATRRASVLTPAALRLPRVHVAPDRVIRTIVGLRPFRPSGFVVRAEKFDSKTVIHNYGHGGAGITLSWGTAHLAIELVSQTETREAAVIGCGVVGLTTARLLQQRGYSVTIYTKAMPPDTTSNIAGGYWAPVTLFDDDRATPAFRKQFGEASRFAFRFYQSLAGDPYGVRWLPVYALSRNPIQQLVPATDEIAPLYPEPQILTPTDNPFGAMYARRRQSMLIEPAIFLAAIQRDFMIAGGKLIVRDFHDARELEVLPQSLIFNCTGLGARDLFHDNELIPVRGQLTFLLPQPEIQYMTTGPDDIYMFPRHDGILLGGSHERNNWSMEPDPATTARVLRENAALFNGMP